MKKFALLFCLFVSTLAFAQEENADVIYLNDGSVLKGKIVERLEDGAIKMVMSNGREIIISMKEVKQVTIEGIGTNPVDYGGKTAVGFSLIGEGFLVGGHFRFRLAEDIFGDVSFMPELIALQNRYNDDVILDANIILGAESSYFLNRRFKEKKQKVRANGIYVRASHGFGKYDTSVFSAGWSSEYFRLNRFKKGFLLNLGMAVKLNHWVNDLSKVAYAENIDEIVPLAYFRIQWNLFK